MQNSIVEKKQKFSEFMENPAVKKMILENIGGKEGQRFRTSIVAAVANNTNLQKCAFMSIVSSAMIGESLKLSPSPQMGHYYLVPYSNAAQFQMGYKGYIQLALRSGHYKDIDAICIKQGEFKGLDKNTGKPLFEFITDPDVRDSLPVVGYLGYFEMTNGFIKRLYWTRTAMEIHGKKYSKSYSSFWGKGEDGFNGQAIKTILKQLLSRWGLLSIEMQSAIEADGDEQVADALIDSKEPKNITPATPEVQDDPFLTATEDDQGRLIDANGKPL